MIPTCSFLISFLRSASCFSLILALVAFCTYKNDTLIVQIILILVIQFVTQRKNT